MKEIGKIILFCLCVAIVPAILVLSHFSYRRKSPPPAYTLLAIKHYAPPPGFILMCNGSGLWTTKIDRFTFGQVFTSKQDAIEHAWEWVNIPSAYRATNGVVSEQWMITGLHGLRKPS